jgi:hypothetical protein
MGFHRQFEVADGRKKRGRFLFPGHLDRRPPIKIIRVPAMKPDQPSTSCRIARNKIGYAILIEIDGGQ